VATRRHIHNQPSGRYRKFKYILKNVMMSSVRLLYLNRVIHFQQEKYLVYYYLWFKTDNRSRPLSNSLTGTTRFWCVPHLKYVVGVAENDAGNLTHPLYEEQCLSVAPCFTRLGWGYVV
jgi:hypothetical protein